MPRGSTHGVPVSLHDLMDPRDADNTPGAAYP